MHNKRVFQTDATEFLKECTLQRPVLTKLCTFLIFSSKNLLLPLDLVHSDIPQRMDQALQQNPMKRILFRW